MSNELKQALTAGLNVISRSPKSGSVNNKEFKLFYSMKRCLEMNVEPSEKDLKIFAKLVKKHGKLIK